MGEIEEIVDRIGNETDAIGRLYFLTMVMSHLVAADLNFSEMINLLRSGKVSPEEAAEDFVRVVETVKSRVEEIGEEIKSRRQSSS